MTSKPVGLRAKLEALRRDLVAIRFPGTFDEEAALLGKSRALIPVLQYLLGAGFSSVLASQFEDLQTSNRGVLSIRNFITFVFMFAREVLGMKMTITATQFMSEGFAERKLAMLHEFIKACRQHHATLCISHKCLPQASPKLNVEEGRRDQLHDSISNCSTNKMKDMKRRQSCNEEKTKFTNSEAAQEPRPFPLGIFNLETQAGVTGMQDLSSVERNNARANLPLLELNVLQQRISSTECFHQQLRNTFNALQIKMEANLRVLEARINALERAHPISDKKWPQIKESLWLDRRQNLARCRVSNMTFNPLFQVADVSAFNNLHEKEDLADQIIRTHSNKVATNLEATLEQAKSTLSDLEYYLAC